MEHMRKKKLSRIIFYFGYLLEPVVKIRRINVFQNSGELGPVFFFHKSPFIFLSSKKCKNSLTPRVSFFCSNSLSSRSTGKVPSIK